MGLEMLPMFIQKLKSRAKLGLKLPLILKRFGSPEIVLLLVLLLPVIFFNSGCWDKKEIEDLAFLGALGLDREDNGDIIISALIVKPFAISGPVEGSGGASSSEKPFWLAHSTGRTVLEAMCNFATFTPRTLFSAHNRFIVFGEESARAGIADMLDFFERNRESRTTAHLLIIKGMKASNFLKSEFELVPLPPEGGLGVIQNAKNRLSTAVDVNINDFLIALEEEGIEPVAACFKVIPKKPVPLEGELKREEIIQSPLLEGAAAFKGDNLVGWLSPTETRGLQWIRGKIKKTTLVVENPDDPSSLLGIEVSGSRSKVIPSVSGGKPQIDIKVELKGNIDDAQGYFNPGKDLTVINKIEKKMARVVEKEIKAVLQRCQQELNTDVFGFGATINRAFPQEWKRLKEQWETEFPELEVSLDVKAHVQYSGLINKSILKE
jgi:spore germination protein KC